MSTSSQNLPYEPPPPGVAPGREAAAPMEATDWKQEVNERLAAHRSRRGRVAAAQGSLPLEVEGPPVRARARVAARVAERYAKAPTYTEMIAQQRKADTLAKVQTQSDDKGSVDTQALLEGLLTESDVVEHDAVRETNGAAALPRRHEPAAVAATSVANASDLAGGGGDGIDGDPDRDGLGSHGANSLAGTEWIPGNVIEFPRVLVAARKARPRLAEGPLREDATVDSDPEHSQLRIFEVEQHTVSNTAQVEAVATEWSSIRLDARPREMLNVDAATRESSKAGVDAIQAGTGLQTAPISDRLMAGMVDGALVGLAFLTFVAVFVACTTHLPAVKPALIAASCTLVGFFFLYQYLFLTYSQGTPGMRYAHIALCTFDDENPTRSQRRSRIAALMLAACPLGLGFAWAWFDEDRLGWHDRMSRTYQRSYG